MTNRSSIIFHCGHPNPGSSLAKGVNRGKILEEQESRRKQQNPLWVAIGQGLQGYGNDWREFENAEGFTHLEELFIYQPADWRKQAREYYFRFKCDLSRESTNELRILVAQVNRQKLDIFMKSPILVVLFHKDIARTYRYETLNFLLAYGEQDPLPSLFCDMTEADQTALMEDLSPLDFFLEFQNYVGSYKVDKLRQIGKDASLPRLCLIKELDFSDIVRQRMAKQLIRRSVVGHNFNVSNWAGIKKGGICINRSPLSMIFAGPNGNGKT